MTKIQEDEHIVTGLPDEEEKISDNALAVMQKAMDEIDKLNDVDGKEENTPNSDVKTIENDDAIENENANQADDIEEYTVDDIEIKRKKPVSKESKYRKLQNDKYRALAEKEEAVKKIAELERLLSESLNSGTYHYSKSAYGDLERAKQNKKIAIETGDIEGLIEADIALTEAINAVNEVKKWAVQDKKTVESEPVKYVDRNVNHNIESDYDQIKQEMAQDWLDTHSYLQPNSRNYNPSLAKQVSTFVNNLDASLRRNNQMDLYFSEDYFDTIDEFISNNMKKSQAKVEKSVASTNHIGGVRHSHAPSINGSGHVTREVRLTPDEKMMCKNAGISESSWIKQKIAMSVGER